MFKKGINSYLNLDEANELIDGIDTTGKWRELTDGERKQYLILATVHIDSLMLTSRKHSAEQILSLIHISEPTRLLSSTESSAYGTSS